MRYSLVLFYWLLALSFSYGQEDALWLNPNKGQWDNRIQYEVKANAGAVFVENDGLTYVFHDAGHDHHEVSSHEHNNGQIKYHAVCSKFLGVNENSIRQETMPSQHYNNYFLGSNPTGWKSNVFSFQQVVYQNYYEGIDYILSTSNRQLEYQFLLAPSANPDLIKRSFKGADQVLIDKNGDLIVKTSLGEVRESKPKAFELSENGRKEIKVEFKLKKGILSFYFPDGYDTSKTLLIDPSLTFSSFTGSTADNWGMTAAPGPNGELIGGGIVFGVGYPVTTGTFDNSYNGGEAQSVSGGFDIGISKYSGTGNQLLFSTYIGGSRNELPQSIVSTITGDIYILGITSSGNFPVTNGSYDTSFGAGTSEAASGLLFNGTDLFVLKLAVDGRSLLASTFIGGSQNEGFNVGGLQYNYGDGFRGDIIIDGENNVYVASNSRSSDFPITTGGAQLGAQDAIVFKMNSNLSNLIWSRRLGGSGVDCANSLILSNDGKLYVAGGTISNDFPGMINTVSGGADGFLTELSAVDGRFIRGVYIGTNAYDQVYFVQTDVDNMVYVFGQSAGAIPITPGKYSNPGGGQFIQKYNPSFNLLWSTRLGGVNGAPQISPTAFLISDCYDIFYSGWGGQVNLSSLATQSTTNNFPVTPDAFQSITNGSNFYLGILSQDANSLVYGTFMGGTASSSNHVDGGTSRFDKSGAVYHAVCAACGGMDNGFTTTPGSFSTRNPSPNCNMAVFKFQLGMPYSLSPDSEMCYGSTYQLNVSGGTSYTWYPATGLSNPNISNPIARPTETTVYYVNMDFNEGCSIVDSVVVTVVNPPTVELINNVTICTNDEIEITASGGVTYRWFPDVNISATDTRTVRVSPTRSMYYYVDVSNDCFTTRDSIWVEVRPLPEIILVQDTVICKGDAIVLNPLGMDNIQWRNHSTLTTLENNRARVNPRVEQFYYVSGTDLHGCENVDSVFVRFFPIPNYSISPDTTICLGATANLWVSDEVNAIWMENGFTPSIDIQRISVEPNQDVYFYVLLEYLSCEMKDSVKVQIVYLPIPVLPDSIVVCENVPITISAQGATSYLWSPSNQLNLDSLATVIFRGKEDQLIQVAFTNICGTVFRTLFVDVINPYVKAYGDTIICPGESTAIWAEGAMSYRWEPRDRLNTYNASSVIANPNVSTLFFVYGTDMHGCVAIDSVLVNLYPQPFVHAGTDLHVIQGDSVVLIAIANGPGMISWSPTEYLGCVDCPSTYAIPEKEMVYTVTFIDSNNCVARDIIQVLFTPLVYIPNTFTPDGTGVNDWFRVVANNISSMEINIFNRWGELIFNSQNVNDGWDGTYKGVNCPDGTYTWKLKYVDLRGNENTAVGHINVLR